MNAGFKIPPKIDAELVVQRGFDLRGYLNFFWRHWIFITAVVALALLMGMIYLLRATPRYTATTQVLLEQREKAPVLEGTSNDGRNPWTFVEDQLAILQSDSLLRRVVLKERLARPSTMQSQGAGQGNDSAPPDEQAIITGISELRGALEVKRNPKAQVLNIAITWGEPVRAAQLANAVADAYVVDQLDARLESAKRASGWLSDRLVELRRQLRESEEAAAAFRREHGLARSGPTVALNDQQLSELNSKLIAARADAAEKKARVDFIADLAAGKKTMNSFPDSIQSTAGAMAALRTKLADASQREADLLARYNSRHPAVVNIEAEKRDIERSIAAESQRITQTIKSEYELAKARLDATERAMREATGQGELDNDDTLRLRELERTAAVNKSLFEDFLQKAKITDEQATFRAQDVRVIMPAQRGGQSFPNTNRTYMMALIIGLALGLGGAFGIEMLQAGFTGSDQLEDALGIPVFASVRRLNKNQLLKDGKLIPLPFYQLHYPLSPFSEAMRTLRSSIHMSDVDHPPKVVHFTSARPGEGKTTLAIALAISAASSGLKVALIDCDLRHPSTTRFFGLAEQKGVVDLLLGTATAQDAFVTQQSLKLVVVPAGSKSLNPPDVLGSERMRALISHLSEAFDYVVIDSPPVGPVIDAAIVAKLADKTVFVIEWGSTPRDLVAKTLQQLSNHKRVAGVVLNSVVQSRAKKYGVEYYYGKSYEKYYSEA